MTDSPNVHFEILGNTGIITLSNPPGNELLQPDFISVAQLTEWAQIPWVNGLIITGAGRNFSSGARLDDVFSMASDKEFLIQKMDAGKEVLNALENLDIPVIALINGICFGGGLEIALACHIRVCSENALFAFPEINHQLMPGLGGSIRLRDIIGESQALGVLLSGDTLNAEEALQMKLVDHCRPKSEVLAFATGLMAKMVEEKPKKVVQSVVRSWHNSRNLSYSEALKEETRLFYELAKDELLRRESNS